MPDKFMDYYYLDELFTDEEKILRSTVRNFVDAEVLPIIEEHYRNGTFPLDLIPKRSQFHYLRFSNAGT